MSQQSRRLRCTLHGKRVGLWVFLETSHFFEGKEGRARKHQFLVQTCALNKKPAGKWRLQPPSSFVEKLVPSPCASSPSSHPSVPFSVYFPSLLFHFRWVFFTFEVRRGGDPSPHPAFAAAHTPQNLWPRASHHAFPTRISKARESSKRAPAFRHTCQAGLRSPPLLRPVGPLNVSNRIKTMSKQPSLVAAVARRVGVQRSLLGAMA